MLQELLLVFMVIGGADASHSTALDAVDILAPSSGTDGVAICLATLPTGEHHNDSQVRENLGFMARGNSYSLQCEIRDKDRNTTNRFFNVCAKSKSNARVVANRECEKKWCNSGKYGFNCCNCQKTDEPRDKNSPCELD